MPNITQNPDYQLVMKFLQNIRPGDMDQESSEQLMMIGQRIQAGGALTDREREMFEAVVGNMPQMPMNPGDYAESLRPMAKPMPMTRPAGREMPMSQIPMDPGSAVRPSEMPSQDGETYGPSSGVTVAPSNVMNMDDAIAAGLVNPTRPQARPAPMRPQARPMR